LKTVLKNTFFADLNENVYKTRVVGSGDKSSLFSKRRKTKIPNCMLCL
jgi:hypothetical protein